MSQVNSEVGGEMCLLYFFRKKKICWPFSKLWNCDFYVKIFLQIFFLFEVHQLT